MAVFAPQLQSTIAVEQPVQQARVGTALAGLASNLFARPPGGTSKPTSEERFGAAWQKYSKRLEDQGVIQEGQVFTPGTASLTQLRTFGALNPEFSDDVFTRAKTENNQMLQTMEAETSGRNSILQSFYSSGEGQVAAARVAVLREEGKTSEADKLEATLFGDFIKRKADNSRLGDLAKQTGDLTTLSNDAWSVNKSAIRDTADIASRGLGELLLALKSSPTAAFDLEQQELGQIFSAFPNITIRTVTKENFGEFAQQLKSEILRTQKMRVEGEVDFTLRDAPAGYEADVFKGLDTIVTWAEKDLEPSEIVSRTKSDAFIRMQQAGIPVGDLAAVDLISKDPTVQANIIGGFSQDVVRYLDAAKLSAPERLEAARAMSTQSMKDARTHFARLVNVYSGKSTEAKPYPEVDMNTRLMGVRDNMLGMLDTHGQLDERTGKPQRFNRAAWTQYFEGNAKDIVQIAAQDSEFAADVGTSLANDIMLDVQKVKEVTKDKGISISFENGQMTFSVNKQELIDNGMILSDAEAADLEKRSAAGDTLARQRLLDYATESTMDEDAYVKQVMGLEGFRKTSANLDDVNYKWNVLNQLGQVGASVKSTIEKELGVQQVVSTGYNLPDEVSQDTEFLAEVSRVSKNIGMQDDWLLRAIEFETAGSWSPSIKNPGSSATGLIQFMANTAKSLGTTTSELAGMTRSQQMKFVEKYLEPYKGRIKNFGDLYMAIHWPKGVGKSDDYVLYKKGQAPYEPNKNLDANGDGVITRGEAVQSAVNRTGGGMMTTPNTAAAEAQLSAPAEQLLPSQSEGGAGGGVPITSLRPQARPEAADATAQMPAEITPAEGALPGDQGLARVANSPVFTRELQRFMQTLGVDPEQTFVVADLDELDQAQAQGRLKKGDKVLVGEGKEAFVVEIE